MNKFTEDTLREKVIVFGKKLVSDTTIRATNQKEGEIYMNFLKIFTHHLRRSGSETDQNVQRMRLKTTVNV